MAINFLRACAAELRRQIWSLKNASSNRNP